MGNSGENEKIPQFLPPQLMNLERKLQIQAGEWFEESYFKNDEVAALYAFYQPTQGPFIIVPSMTKEDVANDFTLFSKYTINFFQNKANVLCSYYSFLIPACRGSNA
jgi:hypothetical protein